MVNVFVHLPSLWNEQYQLGISEQAAGVRDRGEDLCLQFDWHVLNPYHSPPPHLDAIIRGSHASAKPRGFGYAPFGWKEGWIWAQGQMERLLLSLRPDAVLYGQDPHVRNGWGFLNDQRDPAVAAYNDTMGILREALEASGFQLEVLIIPETPGSEVQKRGIQRAQEWGLAEFILPEASIRWEEDDMEDPAEEEDEEGPIAEGEDVREEYSHPVDELIERAQYWLDIASESRNIASLRRARRQINKAIRLLRG